MDRTRLRGDNSAAKSKATSPRDWRVGRRGRVPIVILCLTAGIGTTFMSSAEESAVNIGSNLELFVDDVLLDSLQGAERVLNRPREEAPVLVLDEPWEGNNCAFVTVFQDDDLYRMYYRGSQLHWQDGKVEYPHGQVTCYAESTDGIHWEKPDLGLVAFQGSTHNNIILPPSRGSHNFSPFKDSNPACSLDAAYKAVGGLKGDGGLHAFKSGDGIHWERMVDHPVITKGAFDSQNVAFWDATRGEYRAYYREFREGRDIMTCSSPDFIHWSEPEWLVYVPGRLTELYTNQILPYPRAPHILVGFPARYITGRAMLTPLNRAIAAVSKRFGTDYTDTGFMTSRDRVTFSVWGEAFVRPGSEQQGRWVYGDNYQNWGLVSTASSLEGAPPELSVYHIEGCWRGTRTVMRRYTLRQDGFVSVRAPYAGGEMLTKPLIFSGSELILNLATSAAGSVKVEMQTADGKPIEGHTLQDCNELFGDSIENPVKWTGKADLKSLAGEPVRLRFVLKDADLYSMQFR